MRTIRSTKGALQATGPEGVVYFDQSLGYLARVSEPVALAFMADGVADMPSAEELCMGRHLVRRRSGMGDVLCLTAAVKAVQENGGEVQLVTHPRYETIFDHWLGNGVHWQDTKRVVMFDQWLENHPGRKERSAALCFGDWWNLELTDARPEFVLTESEKAQGAERVNQWRKDASPVVAVFQQTGWETRRYREMLKVAHGLAQEGCAVIGFGEDVLPCCKKPPSMPLRELAAVMAACDLVVTGDTGPMHLAAAMNTPSVVVFGCTNAAGSIGPGYDAVALEPEGMDCWPCWQSRCEVGELDVPGSCVRAVEPARVITMALARLKPPAH